MKSWLCASLAAIVLAMAAPMVQPGSAVTGQPGAPAQDETLLAGLQPGHDTFAIAEKRFKAKDLSEETAPGTKEWHDACSGRSILLRLDSKNIIESVTITTLGPQNGKCGEKLPSFLDTKYWATGHGLHLGESPDQVVALYGEPNSSGPASKDGQDLAVMHYQFTSAGSGAPQFMEVLCARDTGRVVEITLASSSGL